MNDTKLFGYGMLATLAMTILMLIGVLTGIAPMPRPIPLALASLVLGTAVKPVLAITGGIAHFLYGGVAALIYPRLFNGNVWSGLGYGAILWLVMQVIFLPILGWGVFGAAVMPAIAVATLVLHLIYGGTLGWLVGEQT